MAIFRINVHVCLCVRARACMSVVYRRALQSETSARLRSGGICSFQNQSGAANECSEPEHVCYVDLPGRQSLARSNVRRKVSAERLSLSALCVRFSLGHALCSACGRRRCPNSASLLPAGSALRSSSTGSALRMLHTPGVRTLPAYCRGADVCPLRAAHAMCQHIALARSTIKAL